MELTFAPAAPEDGAAIFEQSRALILRYEDPEAVDLNRVLPWMRRKIESHIHQYKSVLRNGETVGWFRLAPENGALELDDFYILPPFRNQGIGTAVLNEICAKTDKPIFLCVFTQNTGAIALYRRHGFEITEAISSTRCLMRREVL